MLMGLPAKYFRNTAWGKSSIFRHAQIIKFGQIYSSRTRMVDYAVVTLR